MTRIRRLRAQQLKMVRLAVGRGLHVCFAPCSGVLARLSVGVSEKSER